MFALLAAHLCNVLLSIIVCHFCMANEYSSFFLELASDLGYWFPACHINAIVRIMCSIFCLFYSLQTCSSMFRTLLCGRPNRPHYGSCPSVRPSVSLFVFPQRLLTRHGKVQKTKVGVNVSHDRRKLQGCSRDLTAQDRDRDRD